MNHITIIALLNLSMLCAFTAFAHETDTPLANEMSAMNKPYRSLSKAFRKTPDGSNQAAYIALTQTMLKHAKASVDLTPVQTSKLDNAAQVKMTADYKQAMQASVKTLEQLEAALTAADYTAAKDLLAQLKKQKSDGHDRFQEEEE